MLLTELLHPGLLSALAGAGHGGRILLADGHYPASTAVGPHAEVVHLNLAPGLLDVSTVLDVLLRAVPVESATVMVPPAGPLIVPMQMELWISRTLRQAALPTRML